MPIVFISYRRVDSEWAARSLCERLREHFGQSVFMDVDTIQPGDDFVAAIDEAVGNCDALIAIIGSKWLDVCDDSGQRRLDDDRDFIRLEIATALRRSSRIIPVLIDDAVMPRESDLPDEIKGLARRNAVKLRPTTFGSDVGQLIQFLQVQVFGPHQAARQESASVGGEAASAPPAKPELSQLSKSDSSRDHRSPRTASAPRRNKFALDPEVAAKAAKFGPQLTASFDLEAYEPGRESTINMLVELRFDPPEPAALEPVPNNIGLLLDVSGSMRREGKFELMCSAVRAFLERLPSKDRASIVLFADESYVAADCFSGGLGASSVDALLDAIRNAPNLFSRRTNLSPALADVHGIYSRFSGWAQGVERVYVLTDGRWHDRDECGHALDQIRGRRAEIGVYGFGTELDVGSIKQLMRGQLGGWVKPIVNKPDIITCFGHLTEVSQSLLAAQGRLVVCLDNRTIPLDAWSFRPHPRYFGAMQKREFMCDLGPIESGRTYSLLFELALHPDEKPRSPIALIRALWGRGEQYNECRMIASVARAESLVYEHELVLGAPSEQDIAQMLPARQAWLVLEALRNHDDTRTQLAARRAELVVARREKRKEELREALAKDIRRLEREIELESLELSDSEIMLGVEEEFLLSPAQAMLADADQDSAIIAMEPLEMEVGEDTLSSLDDLDDEADPPRE